jgi:tRNA G37 N-methylase Trm5
VIGTWAGERVPTAEGFKAKALEKKQFEFSADGKLHAVESMKGQTDEFLKEDWQFESWGTWDIKGDTVLLKITRELCQKQVFENFREVDGKKKWVREEKPTYDTTITDGSKDRYMTWDYFEQWLKKRK